MIVWLQGRDGGSLTEAGGDRSALGWGIFWSSSWWLADGLAVCVDKKLKNAFLSFGLRY